MGVFAQCYALFGSRRSRGEGEEPAWRSLKMGSLRISWGQNAGTVLANFSFGVGSAAPFAKSQWGIGVQEAVKYDYILSSGGALGVKAYIDYSYLLRSSSFSDFAVNPRHITSLGVAASVTF